MPILGLNQHTGTSDLLVESSSRLGLILKNKGTQMVLSDHSLQIAFIVAKSIVAIKTKLPIGLKNKLEQDHHIAVGFRKLMSSHGLWRNLCWKSA